jgi:hypothetical protein
MLGGAAAAVDPAVRDRIVQAAVKIVIEPIFEADFQPSSFGFNVRHVNMPDVLYAIRNGGFSGAIMPADVTGRQARRVAAFVARYSGRERGGEDVTESGEQTP